MGCKVNMMTMGTCKNWLWITVDDRVQVIKKVADAALIRLNKTGAVYVIRHFFKDTAIRYLLVKSKEPSKLTTLLAPPHENHWIIQGAEKFSGIYSRVWVTEAHRPERWQWDLDWETTPGAPYPPHRIEGSNPPLWAVRPSECQVCYNEDHSTRGCPIVDKSIDGVVLCTRQQMEWVDEGKIPNSRSTEVWPPAPKAATEGLKRKAEDEPKESATRKRLRMNVQTPMPPTPRGETRTIARETPTVKRVYERSQAELKKALPKPPAFDEPMVEEEEEEDQPASPSARYSAQPASPPPSFLLPPSTHQTPSLRSTTPLDLDNAESPAQAEFALKFAGMRTAWYDTLFSDDNNPGKDLNVAKRIAFDTHWHETEKKISSRATQYQRDVIAAERIKVEQAAQAKSKGRAPAPRPSSSRTPKGATAAAWATAASTLGLGGSKRKQLPVEPPVEEGQQS